MKIERELERRAAVAGNLVVEGTHGGGLEGTGAKVGVRAVREHDGDPAVTDPGDDLGGEARLLDRHGPGIR